MSQVVEGIRLLSQTLCFSNNGNFYIVQNVLVCE